jgi:hypothetical protein
LCGVRQPKLMLSRDCLSVCSVTLSTFQGCDRNIVSILSAFNSRMTSCVFINTLYIFAQQINLITAYHRLTCFVYFQSILVFWNISNRLFFRAKLKCNGDIEYLFFWQFRVRNISEKR